MARPGLEKHVKFKRLVLMLGIPRPHVRGHLETLWDVAYENGDPVIGDSEAVEAAAEWHGEPGKLFEALLTCGGSGRSGLIEPVENGGIVYQVHDLFHHAPDYVKKRRARENHRKSKNGNQAVRRTADTDRRNDQDGRTPAPAPAPAPNKDSSNEESLSCPDGHASVVDLFGRFWSEYPARRGKKRDRQGTLDSFRKLSEADQMLAIVAARNYAQCRDAKAGFAMDPPRFFQRGKWRDWLEPEPLFGNKGVGPGQVYDPNAQGSF